MELDADGNIWAPTVIDSSFTKPYYLKLFSDEAISEISTEGKLLYKKSVAEILI